MLPLRGLAQSAIVLAMSIESHVAPVRASNVKHGLGQLSQRAAFARLHQDVKQIFPRHRRLLHVLKGGLRVLLSHGVKCTEVLELMLFLIFRGPNDLAGHQRRRTFFAQEGVHANDRILTGVLEHLVVQALFLDAGPLVHGFHRTEDPAAFSDAIKLAQDGFFDEIRQLFDDE